MLKKLGLFREIFLLLLISFLYSCSTFKNREFASIPVSEKRNCVSLVNEIIVRGTHLKETPSVPLRSFKTFKEYKQAEDNILKIYPNLEKRIDLLYEGLPNSQLINNITEIPFSISDGFRAESAIGKMVERSLQLDKSLQTMILNSYNSLVDKEILNLYFKDLFIETAEWMNYKGRKKDIELLQKGKISEQSLAVVLVLRLKEKGDTSFTTLFNGMPPSAGRIDLTETNLDLFSENHAFRAVIKTGPFFDFGFDKWSRGGHGGFTHMLQRDIVSTYALPKDPEKTRIFWDYLSTSKGIAFWADLFDAGGEDHFTTPENITTFIMHFMGDEAVDLN